MSLELQEVERQSERKQIKLGRLVEGGLVSRLQWAGAEILGFTIKLGEYDCLVIVRGVVAGRPQVCFVGGSDLAGCLLKLDDLAGRDKLVWRPDKFAKDEV